MKIDSQYDTMARRMIALMRDQANRARVQSGSIGECAYPQGTRARAIADHTATMWRTVNDGLRELADSLERDIS